jgi:AbiV family abortive infection protein
LKNLTAKQSIEGINSCLDNAKSLFNSGIAVRRIGNIGLANSIQILCLEELIKAFAIYNAFLIDDDRDISKVFRSHIEKLSILKEGYEMISTETLSMVKSFKQAQEDMPKATIKELEKRAKELHKVIRINLLNDAYNNERKENIEWWDKANITKQNGFYVDFKNGRWHAPSDISIEDLAMTEEKVLLVMNHMEVYRDIDKEMYKSKNKN